MRSMIQVSAAEQAKIAAAKARCEASLSGSTS
jgi:hypothetical protein